MSRLCYFCLGIREPQWEFAVNNFLSCFGHYFNREIYENMLEINYIEQKKGSALTEAIGFSNMFKIFRNRNC